MRYQTYVLHLIDGTAIPMVEDYDLPAEKGIVGTSPKQPQTRFLPWATGFWALPISPRAALFSWKPAE